MGQYTQQAGNIRMIYGYNHRVGFFYSIEDVVRNQQIEHSDQTKGLQPILMAEKMQKFKCPKQHIQKVLMMQPI